MNKKASILMIVLWVIAMLGIFALSLSYRGSINLMLARFQRDTLRAKCMIKTAMAKCQALLRDNAPPTYDSLDSCGVNLNNQAAEQVFSYIQGGTNATFRIGEIEQDNFIYGLVDEERKININKIEYAALLKELFKTALTEEEADAVFGVLSGWISVSQTRNAFFKQGPLKRPQELLLVLEYYYRNLRQEEKNMAAEKARQVYNILRPNISVCTGGKINVNTASPDVLKILARSTGPTTGNIDNLVDSLIIPARPFQSIPDDLAGADAQQTIIWSAMKEHLIVRSNFFRINVVVDSGKVSKTASFVYSRTNKEVLYAHED